jgi:hypothetical protein
VNDNGRKAVSVVTTVMATLIVVGVGAVFSMSRTSSAKQSEHETSRESHNIDKISEAVMGIQDSVTEIEKQQIRQTAVMEEIRGDIDEIREGQP